MSPDDYIRDNIQQRIKYDQTCRRIFDYLPAGFPNDERKITYAAAFLRKEPAKN